MKPLLLRLELSNEARIDHSTNGRVTSRETLSERSLRAEVMVSASDDPEASSLGFVRLTIEAQPRTLPSMTPDQTVDWLLAALKQMI